MAKGTVPALTGGPPEWKERGMLDVLMVALTIVAFGALFALIAGLERV